MEEKEKTCATCKHETLQSGIEPCCSCVAKSKWEPKFIPDESPFPKVSAFTGKPAAPAVGIDLGAPEGSLGVTAIIRETVDAVDENWKLNKYAVAGIRAELAALGLRLTDKDMPRGEYWRCMDRLYSLARDLSVYEEKLEKIEKAAKAGQVPKP